MHALQITVSGTVVLLLSGLFAVITVQLLTGRIATQSLFNGRKKDNTPYFSPERIQLLIFTIGGAFAYLLSVFQNPELTELPTIPEAWLAVLGGSNALFVAGKAVNTSF